MHNIHWFLECFWMLIIFNCVLNWEIMYKLPIFSLVWSYHENHHWPCFKFIFLNINYFVYITHFIKFLKFLDCFNKTIQNNFSNWTLHDALFLFKPLRVLNQSLFFLLPAPLIPASPFPRSRSCSRFRSAYSGRSFPFPSLFSYPFSPPTPYSVPFTSAWNTP